MMNKKQFLLFSLIPLFSYGKETFTNEQGIKIKYTKPSVSCIYDKEAYEGYLNTCLMVPNLEICAQTKYEMHICSNENEIKKLEVKSKK